MVGLIFGVMLWLWCDDRWTRSPARLIVDAVAIALCFVPLVQRGIGALCSWLEQKNRLRTALVFVDIVAASIGFLYSAGVSSNRQWLPAIHDEFSYLLQARMFASGHLAMPEHPLGKFFDTFYVITDRAYASQ